MTQYSDMFRCVRLWSQDLAKREVMTAALVSGLVWMRRAEPRHFNDITRNPTIGFTVELFVTRHPGCIPLDSPKAKRMLRRLCYFTSDIR